jgi:uridylate kinase
MREKNNNTIPTVLSLGGSLVVPDGIDVGFVKRFRSFILSQVRSGRKFVVIVGGGKTARRYQRAGGAIVRMKKEDLDWIGIHASRLNAQLLLSSIERYAHPRLVTSLQDAPKKLRESVLVAAGFVPGSSTDLRAVQLGKLYKAKTILNLSNIDWVYSDDPRTHPKAKKIQAMTWVAFRKKFGTRWDPGANVPFDPVASRLAQKQKMRVIITRGDNFKNLRDIITGRKHTGTILS